MKHIHMDEFAKLESPLHAMDPRLKALAIILFIFISATLTNPQFLAAAVVFWIIILLLSRIPASYVVRRLTWVIPFAGVLILLFPFITPGDMIWNADLRIIRISATSQGLERALMLLLRVLASVLAIVTLMSTTRFNNLMKALSDLRVPAIIIQMLEFTIRYIFVIIDELKRMSRARKARGFVLGRNLWHFHTIKTLAQLVGLMFIRAYERGDRVYIAMISRGFTGKTNSMNNFVICSKDYLLASLISLVAIFLLVLDRVLPAL
ncbi:cobalt ECF transporter T component CbiQ [Phosphitispora sp. TUW77]|uniref:cobalt ECF transporter T component CbiQ n=1 Tax=Phosphitispora sp. TUW77 TaxID=3152361 RepID=UPI003AB40D26